jgi:TolA-binding protein
MTRTKQEKCVRDIRSRFVHLTQLVYVTSGTAAGVGIAISVLFNNAGMAIAGVGAAGLSFYALAPSRDRAAHTAATLLLSNDEAWERKIADIAVEKQTQINALVGDRLSLSEKLDKLQSNLTQKLAESHSQLSDRQRQIDALKVETTRLHSDKRSVEQNLCARLTQTQESLEQAQRSLLEKRHDLAVHLDAIEIQILDIWNPLYVGLVAICDRFDPSRPVSDLEYAGKPVTLDETEKRQWKHYRDSLSAYDAGLRERISRLSEDCESHDEAYGFFLRLSEEMTVNYCKLWAGIQDLKLLTTYEGEK